MELEQDELTADKSARREHNRLRVAWRLMGSRQRLARRGLSIMLLGWIVIYGYGDLVRTMLGITANNADMAMGWSVVSLFLALGLAIPFLRCPCAKCGKPYHRMTSVDAIFRSVKNPQPCAYCGFDMRKRVSRY